MGSAPPPFVPPPPGMAPPRRKSNTALIITIILVCLLVPCIGIIAVAGWGWSMAKRNFIPWVGCGFNMQETARSLRDYSKDHNGALPSASQWQDQVRSYLVKEMERPKHKNNPFGGMDTSKPFGCQPLGDAKQGSGIAFNSDLSGKKLSDISDTHTVLVYEVEAPAPNASGPYKDRGETAPKIFGSNREWLTVDVRGRLHGMDSSNRRSGSFNEDWGDSSDSSSDSSDKSDKSENAKTGKTDAKGEPSSSE